MSNSPRPSAVLPFTFSAFLKVKAFIGIGGNWGFSPERNFSIVDNYKGKEE